MSAEKKTLVTAAGPAMQPILERYSLPSFQRFGEAQGYGVHAEALVQDGGARRGDTAKRARWQKLSIMRKALEENDVVAWFDADVIIARTDEDVAIHLNDDDFQGLNMQNVPAENRMNPNTGVWVMRNATEAFDFLDSVEEVGMSKGPWADQRAVSKVLGWHLEGGGSTAGAKPGLGTNFILRTAWLPVGWNQPYMGEFRTEKSNKANYIGRPSVDNPNVMHFMAMEMDERELAMSSLATQLGVKAQKEIAP